MLKAPSAELLNTDAAISYYALALPRKGAQHGTPMTQELILCDERGCQTGLATWDEAHASPGKLHLAFSVYVFSPNRQRILIQKRSERKPLFAGIWANTCCSHERRGEIIEEAAERRLKEECGLDCSLGNIGSFVYKANDPSGNGSEHEHVTILVGMSSTDVELNPNPEEVAELRWVDVEKLWQDMRDHPNEYAPWFHLGLKQILNAVHA